MASGLHGVNHIACLAKNIDETVDFYKKYLDIPLKSIVNNTPGHMHIALDLGDGGTLDFFEAKPGTVAVERNTIGGLNHFALTADPDYIDAMEQRLTGTAVHFRLDQRGGQKTIYVTDPNGIEVQLYPSSGGSNKR